MSGEHGPTRASAPCRRARSDVLQEVPRPAAGAPEARPGPALKPRL